MASASFDTQPLGCQIVGDNLGQHPVHKINIFADVLGQENVHALVDRGVQRLELCVGLQHAFAVVFGVGLEVAWQSGN